MLKSSEPTELFAGATYRPLELSPDAHKAARHGRGLQDVSGTFLPSVDERTLEVYQRARNPEDPFELRNLWLGRVEHELGHHGHRALLREQWRSSRILRRLSAEEVLRSRATVRFVKELFNWFFRDDLYGELRSGENIILSSGASDEQAWGLPETLKACIGYAADRDLYGYSDCRGRTPVREAIAEYENARIEGSPYAAENVAVTMGGTFAVSTLTDFVFLGTLSMGAPSLCGVPNYPPLVEAVARRREVQLVPLPASAGRMSLDPVIAALRPNTPLVLLQTVANPTGAAVADDDLARLVEAASPSTIIFLDESHEWLGPTKQYSCVRAASNVVRVCSISKSWSAPGLKLGWILADAKFVAEYYEYASTTFGGPPSFFSTLVEVLARMERWLVTGMESVSLREANEFASSYQLDVKRLQAAFVSYRRERIAREEALVTLRDAAVSGLTHPSTSIIHPLYSINMAVSFSGWDDSYRCFRDLLRETGVSVFPGILTFCFSGGIVRVTTARKWADLSAAIARIQATLSANFTQ